MSGSKTVYYVSSSSFPLFKHEDRINQFEAALLDYTSNSPLELSEYLKTHYNVSRLKNYRGYLNWCDREGFTDTFGKIDAVFYGDAKLDNSLITSAIKGQFTLDKDDTFQVYQSNLAFFSEDFYIKHLASRQGKAEWVHQGTDADYTIEYPNSYTIRAVFNHGGVIEGTLPSYTSKTRFIEISYSIIRVFDEVVTIPPSVNPDTGESIPEQTVTNKVVKHKYGYLHYQENTGNSTLDSLIKDNGIKGDQTFFPAIPIRNDTKWYTGREADVINSALKYLEINSDKDKDKLYTGLQKMCIDGMSKGSSINDIDYITLLMGVNINTPHQSDLRYLYEFWLNVHINNALSQGNPPANIWEPQAIWSGKGLLRAFKEGVTKKFIEANYSDQYYTKFVINCSGSNLNLTYSWGGSEYFEANGQFKPGAKVGEYGILSCDYTYKWTTQEIATDDEGHALGHWVDEDTFEYYYETVDHSIDTTLCLFCKQESNQRWRFILFIDLNKVNLVYAGKTIRTTAHAGYIDDATTIDVFHDFSYDLPSPTEAEDYKFTFKYVTTRRDSNADFIVPLERNTFYEVGVVNELEIAYASSFLIFNCWVKKKKKWYQNGFFQALIGIVGIVLSFWTAGISASLATAGYTVAGYAVTAVSITLMAVGVAFAAAGMLQGLHKVLNIIFGDQLGAAIYGVISSIVKTIAGVLCAIPGWNLVGVAIIFAITTAEAINAGGSLGKAFLSGFKAAAQSYVVGQIGMEVGKYVEAAVNGTEFAQGLNGSLTSFETITMSGKEGALTLGTIAGASASGFVTNSINSVLNGNSLGSSLTQGLISGLIAGAGKGFTSISKSLMKDMGWIKEGGESLSTGALEKSSQKTLEEMSFDEVVGNIFMSQIAKNPMTYINLMQMGIEERNVHKLANLENDYKEFANKQQAFIDALYNIHSMLNSTATAEFVCKLQSNIGRMLSTLPEMNQSMTPDRFLSLALTSGSDQLKASLGTVPCFVDSKLQMEGYYPYQWHYVQTDNTMAWDS